MVTHWLLIGGPAHGKAVHIKQGSRVLCEGAIYDGTNYLSQGRLYRIGYHEPSEEQKAQTSILIEETKLRHIAGD